MIASRLIPKSFVFNKTGCFSFNSESFRAPVFGDFASKSIVLNETENRAEKINQISSMAWGIKREAMNHRGNSPESVLILSTVFSITYPLAIRHYPTTKDCFWFVFNSPRVLEPK